MDATTIARTQDELHIDRPVSPSPSDISTCYEFDDYGEEVEVLPISSLTASIFRDTEQASPITQHITPPSTPPTRLLLPLHTDFSKLEISPASGSERSTTSTTSANTDLESPITTRSGSASSGSNLEFKPSSHKPTRIQPSTQDPCLQCHLLGLSCSFSARTQRPAIPLNRMSKLCCVRCVRNGEYFCILQLGVEPIYRRSGRNLDEKEGSEYVYYAEGVEREAVLEKAEELLEARRAKSRFALPKASAWRREILRPVFGGWLVQERVKKEG